MEEKVGFVGKDREELRWVGGGRAQNKQTEKQKERAKREKAVEEII